VLTQLPKSRMSRLSLLAPMCPCCLRISSSYSHTTSQTLSNIKRSSKVSLLICSSNTNIMCCQKAKVSRTNPIIQSRANSMQCPTMSPTPSKPQFLVNHFSDSFIQVCDILSNHDPSLSSLNSRIRMRLDWKLASPLQPRFGI